MSAYLADEIRKKAETAIKKADDLINAQIKVLERASLVESQKYSQSLNKQRFSEIRKYTDGGNAVGGLFELKQIVSRTYEIVNSYDRLISEASRLKGQALSKSTVNPAGPSIYRRNADFGTINRLIPALQADVKNLDELRRRLKTQVGNFLAPDGCNQALMQSGGVYPPSTRFIFKGPAGLRIKMTLRHERGTGGHMISVGSDPVAVGRFYVDNISDVKPEYSAGEASFSLPRNEQVMGVTYQATNFCGNMLVEVFVGKELYRTFHIPVFYPGLEKLPEHPVLHPYQGSDEIPYHPSEVSHYGKPELNAKLLQLADEFQKIYPDHKIWVNDMSLPTGGMFKTFNNLKKGHMEHMWGDDVDLSFNWLRYNFGGDENSSELEKQRLKLEELIVEVFGNSNVDFHGGKENLHWHCSLKAQNNRRRYKDYTATTSKTIHSSHSE